MCVIVAKKCRLKNTKKENWFLYKIRDRNYDPVYKLKVEINHGIETLFLIDQINKWSEGVNSTGLMIVSAALDNHADFEDNGERTTKSTINKKNKESFTTLSEAMSCSSVEEAEKILTDDRFVGTTFISDGDKLVILEIYINDKAYEREALKIGEEKLANMTKIEQGVEIKKGIKDEDYDVARHEVVEDTLAVRTNHGKLLSKAGYQKNDEDLSGYNSSVARWEITKKAIEKLGDDAHPFDVLTTIKNLKGINKSPQDNPIRIKTPKDKDGKMPYYTGTVVMLTPTGTLFAVPINDDVEQSSKLRLKKDRKVDFVLLPKNLPLFEDKNNFRILTLRDNGNYFR